MELGPWGVAFGVYLRPSRGRREVATAAHLYLQVHNVFILSLKLRQSWKTYLPRRNRGQDRCGTDFAVAGMDALF